MMVVEVSFFVAYFLAYDIRQEMEGIFHARFGHRNGASARGQDAHAPAGEMPALRKHFVTNVPGVIEGRKEFHTEVTEVRHRDHGEVRELFSVHSVVKWFDNTDG